MPPRRSCLLSCLNRRTEVAGGSHRPIRVWPTRIQPRPGMRDLRFTTPNRLAFRSVVVCVATASAESRCAGIGDGLTDCEFLILPPPRVNLPASAEGCQARMSPAGVLDGTRLGPGGGDVLRVAAAGVLAEHQALRVELLARRAVVRATSLGSETKPRVLSWDSTRSAVVR